MRVPESWLRSFCNPPIAGAELAERLTMAGVEVESYEPVGPEFSGGVLIDIVHGGDLITDVFQAAGHIGAHATDSDKSDAF